MTPLRAILVFLSLVGFATFAVVAAFALAPDPPTIASGSATSPGDAAPPTTSMTTQPRYSKSAYDVTSLDRAVVAELAKKLDPETYRVTQRAGTEPAFCGGLLSNKEKGVYACVVCGLPLFQSSDKFDSGTGWPSFTRPFDDAHVTEKVDRAHGMTRTEIVCTRCDAHLGHVFDDGPKPTGRRHCLNSAALTFLPADKPLPEQSRPVETATAYFAGGCFWGIEHYFQKGPGVIDAVSGYMQGSVDNPTYKQVCNGDTGHAEVVKVVFDPKRITYRRLVEAFFAMHDPTQLNRQGPDVGTQYRSGIYTVDAEQLAEARAVIAELQGKTLFLGRRIVTEVEPAEKFYPAEEYHQDYIVNTGRSCHVTNPW